MPSKSWDEILVADHEMIERAMDVLKKELGKLPDRSPDLFSLKRTIDFLLEFGDRIHNQKELLQTGLKYGAFSYEYFQFFLRVNSLDKRFHVSRFHLFGSHYLFYWWHF